MQDKLSLLLRGIVSGILLIAALIMPFQAGFMMYNENKIRREAINVPKKLLQLSYKTQKMSASDYRISYLSFTTPSVQKSIHIKKEKNKQDQLNKAFGKDLYSKENFTLSLEANELEGYDCYYYIFEGDVKYLKIKGENIIGNSESIENLITKGKIKIVFLFLLGVLVWLFALYLINLIIKTFRK